MELLTIFAFLLFVSIWSVVAAVRLFHDERVRRRFVVRWKDRVRVRSMLRIVRGGRLGPPSQPPRAPSRAPPRDSDPPPAS